MGGLQQSKWFQSTSLAKGAGVAKRLEGLLEAAKKQIHDTHQERPLDGVTLSRILVVTATVYHLEGSFSERSNSILRQYGHSSDHFIRVRWPSRLSGFLPKGWPGSARASAKPARGTKLVGDVEGERARSLELDHRLAQDHPPPG